MDRWRLGHRPGLDGLRAIAVLLVMACHMGVPHMQAAGPVGVTVFFALSGFLITCLLLADIESLGRIRLVRFYVRRALRLFPAVIALIAVLWTVHLFVPSADVHADSAIGALLYVNNYLVGGRADWLDHTWSLAVEEQFYILWPFVLIALTRLFRSQAVRIGLVLFLACGPLLFRMAVWAPDGRVPRGLEGRGDALLIGCAFAMWLTYRSNAPAVRRWVPAAGFALIGASVAITVKLSTAIFLPGVVAVGTMLVIAAVVTSSGLPGLRWAPMVWVGRRSYGLYLWHFPVIFAVYKALPGWDWWQAALISVPISLALTILSWRYVEEPFLRLKDRRGSAEGLDRSAVPVA